MSGRARPAPANEELRRAAALVYVADLEALELAESDAHHLATVLRLRDGASVAAADGAGRYRLCALRDTGVRRTAPRLEALGAIENEPAPEPLLAVAFALAKGERSEWAVQKLTELGIDLLVPLVTARTVVRLADADDRRRKRDRLVRVAREAAAQSRRARLPEVTEPMELATALVQLGGAPRVRLAEPGGGPMPAGLRAVAVGPEGGWDPEELTLGGEQRVGLGPTILRAETAAVAAGTLLAARRAGIVGS